MFSYNYKFIYFVQLLAERKTLRVNFRIIGKLQT
jgi:hypothetical protein